MTIDQQRAFARSMRFTPTEAERRLWGYLRKRSLNGFRFNRQVEVGRFIVDFLCREHRLIVEVDGATHSKANEIAYDNRRDAYLIAKGFRVHRVPNLEVFTNMDGVLEGILLALNEEGCASARHPIRPIGHLPHGCAARKGD